MTMKKFNKTLTFESNYSNKNTNNESSNGRQRLSVTKLTAKMGQREREQYYSNSNGQHNVQPLDNKVSIDYANGLSGVFMPIKNEFSVLHIGSAEHDNYIEDDDGHSSDCVERYRDESHWPRDAKKKVKRVRFVICILALLGLALGLMSRLMLNVSIVEMVKKPDVVPGEDLMHEETTTILPMDEQTLSTKSVDDMVDELLSATLNGHKEPELNHLPNTNGNLIPPSESSHHISAGQMNTTEPSSTVSTTETSQPEINNSDDGLRFQWSKKDVNIVLGSFYMGYAPGILFSGSFAQRYGAKYPLFLCVFGSAIINIFTPSIARYSLHLLIASRVVLGLIQGSLLPALYELFNRWLTQTESSIFAPMIKVSMPLGSLIGTIMPGILAAFKLDWPNLFYIGGFMCLVWSAAWVFLATSLPQDNRFVGMNELNRILRKKKNQFSQPATITEKTPRSSSSRKSQEQFATSKRSPPSKPSGTPWLLIVTNPSVLALTAVKFTYNIGMDFIFLQLAVYLREVHNAPIETISVIASSGYCMQMLLISFVGWLAKVVIIKKACGLSVTKWRKVFQGSSNFIMALTYVILAYTSPNLEIATVLLMSVCFWWMMGAGGESMLPYDLSSEYPASIVGFAHSFSIFSGLALSAICDFILGENTEDPEKWSSLFYILAGLLAGGGLIFVVIVKAKPFLPGEKTPKAVRRAMKQQRQQVTSVYSN